MSETVNRKHAYLIVAHHNFSQLQTLIRLLDDSRNDIYLHVDKRSASFQPERIRARHSQLTIIDRISVNWGGHSQIECELRLLKASAAKRYQYYHLISGVDLPVKTQDEIHSFFDSAFPKNYIEFDEKANQTGSFSYRTKYYRLLQDYIGRNTGWKIEVLKKLERNLLRFQRVTGIRRKQHIPIYKGTNWFSITHELVEYLLGEEKLIRKQFYYSVCADEVFLHSVAMVSPYRDSIVDNALRAIDWKRGNPYVYRETDVDELLSSEALFARKFDCRVDRAAIDKVAAALTWDTAI